MSLISSFSADELFQFLISQNNILVLDVRNEKDFERFNVEGPFQFNMKNIPYFDFIEEEDKSVLKVSRNRPIKVICSKEGSAQFVGEILISHGFEDVAYLSGGIKTWGNLLIPKRVNSKSDIYELYQFIRPGKASCSYGLIYNRKMYIFDPSRNCNFYQSFAKLKNVQIVRTFETHLQADYISGSKQISDETGAEILAHVSDFSKASFKYSPVDDNDKYTIGKSGPEIQVFHTPGHTLGSTSYIIDNQYFISGDTIFIHSVGRPDLGGKVEEWANILFKTLTNKIQKMDGNLNVLPGHYIDWTEANDDMIIMKKLSDIKKQNSNVFEVDSPEKFIQFIKDNITIQPQVYKEIRKINSGWFNVGIEEADTMDLGKNECSTANCSDIKI